MSKPSLFTHPSMEASSPELGVRFGADRESARVRLGRLGTRPQWISHEVSVAETRRYLESFGLDDRFTLRALPFRNHTDRWVLRDLPLRRELRDWVRAVVR